MKELLDRLEVVVDRIINKLANRRAYMSETEKIRPRVMEFINQDMSGLDIGCGNDKVFTTACGVDGRRLPTVDVVYDVTSLELLFSPGSMDYVYSSHCLEHLPDPEGAVKQWASFVRYDGYLVLYLPHRAYYTVYNPDHLHTFIQEDIEHMVRAAGCEVICSEMDLGYDRYSFLVVGRKLPWTP
jgi:SAM-dependent methyltransferase